MIGSYMCSSTCITVPRGHHPGVAGEAVGIQNSASYQLDYLWFTQLWVNELVATYECDAQLSGDYPAARLNLLREQ
jgi:hypothetical protein